MSQTLKQIELKIFAQNKQTNEEQAIYTLVREEIFTKETFLLGLRISSKTQSQQKFQDNT